MAKDTFFAMPTIVEPTMDFSRWLATQLGQITKIKGLNTPTAFDGFVRRIQTQANELYGLTLTKKEVVSDMWRKLASTKGASANRLKGYFRNYVQRNRYDVGELKGMMGAFFAEVKIESPLARAAAARKVKKAAKATAAAAKVAVPAAGGVEAAAPEAVGKVGKISSLLKNPAVLGIGGGLLLSHLLGKGMELYKTGVETDLESQRMEAMAQTLDPEAQAKMMLAQALGMGGGMGQVDPVDALFATSGGVNPFDMAPQLARGESTIG